MSSANRATFSIVFPDAKFYNDYIKPEKEDRTLNKTAMKCLLAYFTNPEVRNLVDGGNSDVVNGDNVDAVTTQAFCSDILNYLVVQDLTLSTLQDGIEDGNDEVSSILKDVNNKARTMGVVKPGSNTQAIPKLAVGVGAKVEQTETGVVQTEDMKLLASALVGLAKILAPEQKKEQISALLGPLQSLVKEEEYEEPKVVSAPTPKPIVEVPKPQVTVRAEEKAEEKEEVEPVVDTASENLMSELMGSLM